MVVLNAYPYCQAGEWFVRITANGVEVDEAGPFDDKQDAEFCAERVLDMGDQ